MSCVNYIIEKKINQMLKASGDGGFGGGTSSNFIELEARKLARKERVSSQIIANNDDVANIDFSQQQNKNMMISTVTMVAPLLKNKKGFLTNKKTKRLKNIRRSINGKTVTVSHPRATVRQYNTLIVVLFLKMWNWKMNKETNAQVIKGRNAHINLWFL